jgi:hypothetical protein
MVSRSYRSVGVEVSAHVLNLKLQLVLGALVGALNIFIRRSLRRLRLRVSDLEGEVLEEVRGSVGLVSLCPATGIDPHADRGGLSPWRVISGNLDTY